MKTKIKVCLAIALVGITLPAYVVASPDEPPTLSWTLDLTDAGVTSSPVNPCNQFTDENTRITHLRVGEDGYVYTLEQCNVSGNFHSSIHRRISPSGGLIWSQWYGVTNTAITGLSMDVDPDNRAWFWLNNPAIDGDIDTILIVRDKNNGVSFSKSATNFAANQNILRTTFEELTEDTFAAYAGGGSSRIGYSCTSVSVCDETFELTGNPGGGFVHHGAPYLDTLFGDDLSPTDQVEILSQSAGTIVDSEPMPVGRTGMYRIWINGGNTSRLIVPNSVLESGNAEPRWFEFNSSTLEAIRTVDPIESRPYSYDQATAQDIFSDGEGNVYACGEARTPGVKRDSFLSKYNNTGTDYPGMRWNITVSLETGDSNVDRAVSCDLGPDGSIYVGILHCDNADSACSTQIRKYAGGATARSQQAIFEGYTSGGSVTSGPIGEGPIADMVNFFNDSWGFDGSWLFGLAIVGMVVFPARNARPLYVALMAFIGVGICVALGLFPMWLIFVLVFLVIAVAGFRMFEGADQE